MHRKEYGDDVIGLRIRKRVRYILKSKNSPQLPITGWELLKSNENHICVRALWLTVLCVCFGICCYQGYLRLQYFTSNPVVVDVKWKIMETAEVPPIVVINADTQEVANIIRSLPYDETDWFLPSDLCYDPFVSILTYAERFYNLIDLETMWQLANTSKIATAFSYEKDKSHKLKQEELYFPNAIASRFTSDDHLTPSTQNILKIHLKIRNIPESCKANVIFLLLEESRGLISEMNKAISIEHGTVSEINIQFKTFVYLNRANSRCSTTGENHVCMERCFNKQSREILPTCRFPFMSHLDLPLCQMDNSTKDKYLSIIHLLAGLNCNCHRKCVEKIFVGNHNIHEKKKIKTYTEILITSDGNENMVIQERFAYGLVSFLADIGGNLGLCLGWSLLSVVQVFFICYSSFITYKSKYSRKDLLMRKLTAILKAEHQKVAENKTRPLFGRVTQIIVCTLCMTASLCFVYLRLQYFFSYPVRRILEIEKREKVTFPLLAVCGLTFATIDTMRALVAYRLPEGTERDWNKYELEICETELYDLIDFQIYDPRYADFEHVWKMSKIKEYRENIYHEEKAFSSDMENFTVTEVDLPAGRCVQFDIGEKKFRGRYTLFSISISGVIATTFSDCPKKSVYEVYYALPGESFMVNNKIANPIALQTTAILHMKTIRLLNTPLRRCSDTAAALQCSRDCVARLLLQRITCRMPYMDKYNLPLCNSSVSAREAHFAYQDINVNLEGFLSKCGCLPRCLTTIVSATPRYDWILNFNDVESIILFDSNIVENFVEESAYDLSRLLCDVGGNLGVTVGASLLSAFGTFHIFASALFTKLFQRHQFQAPVQNKNRASHIAIKPLSNYVYTP